MEPNCVKRLKRAIISSWVVINNQKNVPTSSELGFSRFLGFKRLIINLLNPKNLENPNSDPLKFQPFFRM
ncbi:MAG: hypothetical protein RL329_2929 [Bacteroidota bacterium]